MIPLKDYNPTRRRAWITLGIIAINVFVYFVVQPHGQGTLDPQAKGREAIREAEFTYAHAAIPYEVVHDKPLTRGQVCASQSTNPEVCTAIPAAGEPVFPHKNVLLAVIYSMFLHGSLLHIGGNMLFLWVFGNNIEDVMGMVPYLAFYLLSGLAAAAAHIAVSPDSTVPIVSRSYAHMTTTRRSRSRCARFKKTCCAQFRDRLVGGDVTN